MRSTALFEKRSARAYACVAVLIASVAVGCTGGGETVISGFGNSDNYVGSAALWGALADEFADYEGTPKVSDEDLQLAFAAVRKRALEGDLDAALVLLKLSEEQREDEE